MTINISVKMIACRIFHPFFKFHKLRILCCHINLDIRRYSIWLIRKPFDDACVFQRRNTYRTILVIDLWIELIHFKLRNHINHTSHLSVTQKRRRITVKKRNLIKRKFLYILCKLSGLHFHKLLIFLCVHYRRGKKRSQQIYRYDHYKNRKNRF